MLYEPEHPAKMCVCGMQTGEICHCPPERTAPFPSIPSPSHVGIDLAAEGRETLRTEHGVSDPTPWELRGCSDVKTQSGARRIDPNDARLCRHPMWIRGEILSLVEEACQQAENELRAKLAAETAEKATAPLQADLVSAYEEDGDTYVLLIPTKGQLVRAKLAKGRLGALIGALAGIVERARL